MTENIETCGKAKWPMLIKSPVCKKVGEHKAHRYDMDGVWGVRNDRGQYIVTEK